MTFAAKYRGICKADPCNHGNPRINEGELCDFVDDQIMHADCAGEEHLARLAETNSVCPACNIVHSGECW
ncbi:hypothetical protein [Mycolicibacterium sphagni]|uniref:hypothetical protein n=1 Tax=Mycolicibacterium sphagni TaxID=1786 RepID=UPI0021F3AB4C|nr:hypothetical protein [Mycolicibacterium sphagni]MCV7175713.1 hypothetical protein [Mycolicibacterium sphagni]